jgi:molybdenum cofactor guanylyltransferase
MADSTVHLPVTGVILAGGRGRRMGGNDKGLIEVQGRPLIEYAINALRPQVDELMISANRNISVYKKYGYPVVPDALPDFQGPLAGMLAGLTRASSEYVAFVPCDVLSLPDDLVSRLMGPLTENKAEVCMAHDGERCHPVIALLKSSLVDVLQADLEKSVRKAEDWMRSRKIVIADFSYASGSFFSINSPEDMEKISRDCC